MADSPSFDFSATDFAQISGAEGALNLEDFINMSPAANGPEITTNNAPANETSKPKGRSSGGSSENDQFRYLFEENVLGPAILDELSFGNGDQGVSEKEVAAVLEMCAVEEKPKAEKLVFSGSRPAVANSDQFEMFFPGGQITVNAPRAVEKEQGNIHTTDCSHVPQPEALMTTQTLETLGDVDQAPVSKPGLGRAYRFENYDPEHSFVVQSFSNDNSDELVNLLSHYQFPQISTDAANFCNTVSISSVGDAGAGSASSAEKDVKVGCAVGASSVGDAKVDNAVTASSVEDVSATDDYFGLGVLGENDITMLDTMQDCSLLEFDVPLLDTFAPLVGSFNEPKVKLADSFNVSKPQDDDILNLPEQQLAGTINLPEPQFADSVDLPKQLTGMVNLPETQLADVGLETLGSISPEDYSLDLSLDYFLSGFEDPQSTLFTPLTSPTALDAQPPPTPFSKTQTQSPTDLLGSLAPENSLGYQTVSEGGNFVKSLAEPLRDGRGDSVAPANVFALSPSLPVAGSSVGPDYTWGPGTGAGGDAGDAGDSNLAAVPRNTHLTLDSVAQQEASEPANKKARTKGSLTRDHIVEQLKARASASTSAPASSPVPLFTPSPTPSPDAEETTHKSLSFLRAHHGEMFTQAGLDRMPGSSNKDNDGSVDRLTVKLRLAKLSDEQRGALSEELWQRLDAAPALKDAFECMAAAKLEQLAGATGRRAPTKPRPNAIPKPKLKPKMKPGVVANTSLSRGQGRPLPGGPYVQTTYLPPGVSPFGGYTAYPGHPGFLAYTGYPVYPGYAPFPLQPGPFPHTQMHVQTPLPHTPFNGASLAGSMHPFISGEFTRRHDGAPATTSSPIAEPAAATTPPTAAALIATLVAQLGPAGTGGRNGAAFPGVPGIERAFPEVVAAIRAAAAALPATSVPEPEPEPEPAAVPLQGVVVQVVDPAQQQ